MPHAGRRPQRRGWGPRPGAPERATRVPGRVWPVPPALLEPVTAKSGRGMCTRDASLAPDLVCRAARRRGSGQVVGRAREKSPAVRPSPARKEPPRRFKVRRLETGVCNSTHLLPVQVSGQQYTVRDNRRTNGGFILWQWASDHRGKAELLASCGNCGFSVVVFRVQQL